jgi:hypothetical protein
MTLFLANGLNFVREAITSGRGYHRTRVVARPRNTRVRPPV